MRARAPDDRLAAAEREVEVSRQRLADTRENVIEPRQEWVARNSFAEIIAQSLTKRNDGKTR